MKHRGMHFGDIRNIMLVSTFFFLWLAVYFSQAVEEVLAFLLIFSFGILHGANDLEIMRKKAPGGERWSVRLRLLMAYVGVILGSAALFYLFPVAALLFFILFSAYHFGEQHWVKKTGRLARLQKALYLTYGLSILFMLFAAHSQDVSAVILEISGFSVPPVWYSYGCLVFLGLFLLIFYLNFYWNQFLRYLLWEGFLLAVFYVVFNTASLIWAFAIYFVVWHSIPSLADQIRLLYGQITLKNGARYLKSSAIYWIGALLALSAAFLYFREHDFGFLPLFFAFLAAITFPHVLVISRLYKG